jgi:hypothetical protein
MKRHASTLLALAALASPLAAEEKPASPVVFDPAHRSETIDCVRTRTGYTLKSLQIEADATYFHAQIDDWDNDEIDLTGDTFTLSGAIGITDWATAKITVPIRRIDFSPGDVESGIGDVELEGKLSLKKDASPLGFVPLVDVCAGAVVGLPTGDEDEGLGKENTWLQAYASASYWFAPWVGLHGWYYLEVMEGDHPYHGGSAVAEFVPFSRDLSLYAGLEFRWGSGDSPVHVFLPGVEYRVTPMISAGLGLPVGITDLAEDWGVILNLQLTF